jgi:integral membrane protein
MAFVVGVTLLLFCGAIFAKYVLDKGSDTLIAMAHGWLFMLYAVLALDLAIRMRWSVGRMFFMVIAGMVPFLSFVAEHKVSGWVRTELDSATSPAAPAEAEPDIA